MIDKRLLDPRFNPIIPTDPWRDAEGCPTVANETLFDRAMLASLGAVNSNDLHFGTVGSPMNPWPVVAEQCADAALAFLEERARRLGIEVTP